MLRQKSEIIYKVADTADESRQIHRLNYLTFVQEIPQHPTNPDGILVDKFHEKNTYIIAKRGAQLLGMVSFCSQPPYSLHAKLADLDAYLPQGKRIAEIRLLSIAQKGTEKEAHRRIIAVLASFINLKRYRYHHRLGRGAGTETIPALGIQTLWASRC